MGVGGINWLCIGLFQFDLIAGIFGSQANFVSRFLYMIIGLAAIISLIALPINKGKIYEPQGQKSTQNETKKSTLAPKTENEHTPQASTTQNSSKGSADKLNPKNKKASK